jgi:tetratricopeptide (TPR) repeat protein
MAFNKPEAMRQAQQLLRQGNVTSAIAIYCKIVEAEPSDLIAISTLADLYIKSGRVQDAVASFLRVAEHYLKTNSDISARYILNKILKLDAQNPYAQAYMAELCLHEGNEPAALDWLIEAGACFWHKGDVKAAVEVNRRALSIDPKNRPAKAALWALQQEAEPTEPEPLAAVPPVIAAPLEAILISIGEETEGLYASNGADPAVAPPGAEEDEAMLPPEALPVLDQANIIDQIANAEVLAGYGELDAAVATLRSLLMQRPDHIEVRERLKDIYLRAEYTERASEECVNLAAIYAARGETGRARDYLIRAQRLAHAGEPTASYSSSLSSYTDSADDAPQARLQDHLQNA